MTQHELEILQIAEKERSYQASPQARYDLILDKARRAAYDRQVGHSVRCTLIKCADDCPRIATQEAHYLIDTKG